VASKNPTGTDDESTALGLLRQMEDEELLPEHVRPEDALFVVTCVCRQRLTRGEADHLVEALPRAVQRLVVGCTRRYGEQPEVFGRGEFVARVARHLDITDQQAQRVSAEVLRLIQQFLPEQNIQQVASQLPADIRALWLARGSQDEAHAHDGSPEPAVARGREAELTRMVFARVQSSGAAPAEVREPAAVAAVLTVLAQRLSGGEARDLYESLPAGLHPLVAPYILRQPESAQPFDREEFFRRVAERLGVTAEQGDAITRAVMTAIVPVLPGDEVQAVATQLPADLQELWLDASDLAGVPAGAL
jgi:uncharacterized protein (DUF2267 family)